VVDALRTICEIAPPLRETEFGWVEDLPGRLVLVTAHRRENLGVPLTRICEALQVPLTRICEALQQIVQKHADVTILYPVHPNPAVHDAVHEILDGTERVVLCEPPDYLTFVPLLSRADLIITDSGGLQEEGPALGIPVLIVAAADELLTSPAAYQAMTSGGCPYGDGRAAQRICDALEYAFELRTQPPEEFVPNREGGRQ